MKQAVIISRKELQRLAGLRSEQGILSTYLKLDPRLTYDRGQHIAKFKGALKRFAREAGDPWLSSVAEREKDSVLELLELWQPRGRSLVIFSSQPANIREVVHLDVLVPTFVTVDRTANIGLLAQVLDEYPRFAVAVVQRDHAMLYITEQRLAEGLPEISSDVPGQHDQGGWSQARFQRHIEFHYGLHLNRLVEQLEDLHRDRPFKQLVIGCGEDTAGELLKMLPDDLRERVIGTFRVDFKHESEAEILQRAGSLREEEERRSERELVDQIVGAAESGGQGVAGIDGTLQAVLNGRVHVLAVAEGIAAAGCECLSCGYFAAKEFAECPVCGAEPEPVPDVIDRAIEKAYLAGARVEVVLGEAREWLLARGGIGAVLRY
jgi:peptide chain release factor subunit 1